MRIFMFVLTSLFSQAAFTQNLTEFQPGETADANQVNENFRQLDDKINAGGARHFYVDCSNDPNALQTHWDSIQHTVVAPVEYDLTGTCSINYRNSDKKVTFRGAGIDQTTLMGSFVYDGDEAVLRFASITVDAQNNPDIPGEVIRPAGGAMLHVINARLKPGINISAWDSFTRVRIDASVIESSVNLHTAQLSVFVSELSSLSAANSRVYFHGGGVTGATYLGRSFAQFQNMGVENGGSYLTGPVTIEQSDVHLSQTAAGYLGVTSGSRVFLSQAAVVEDVDLTGSSLTISNPEVVITSGQIDLVLSNVFSYIDTNLTYVCDANSHILGDSSNASAEACR